MNTSSKIRGTKKKVMLSLDSRTEYCQLVVSIFSYHCSFVVATRDELAVHTMPVL